MVMVSAPPSARNRCLDIVEVHHDVGDVAEEQDAPAVGRDVDVLATLAPLKASVSVPAWPSTVSLSSPGFQTNMSLPAPSRAVSSPSPPNDESLPSLPINTSAPRPPLSVSWMPAGRQAGGVDHVVAAEAR